MPAFNTVLRGTRRPLTGLTFVGVTASSSATIAAHADARAGDVAILVDRAIDGSPPPVVLPTDFVSVFNDPKVGQLSRVIVSAGLLKTGSGEVLTGMSTSGGGAAKLLFIFRADGTVGGFSAHSSDYNINNGNPGAATASAFGATPVILAIGAVGTTAGTAAFQNQSPALQSVTLQTGTSSLSAGYNLYNLGDTPVSQMTDTDDEGGNNIALAVLIKVEP